MRLPEKRIRPAGNRTDSDDRLGSGSVPSVLPDRVIQPMPPLTAEQESSLRERADVLAGLAGAA